MNRKGLFGFTVFVLFLSLAGISCGFSDVSNLFATETPTPTQTFTPSPTVTPSPTPTQTQTPTPVPTGIETRQESNGETAFIDYDNNFQLALPSDWFIIPLSAKDITEILNSMAEENPELKASADAFKNLDPDIIRVIAVNKDSKYIVKGFSTNLTITAVKDKFLAGLPVSFVTGFLEEEMGKNGVTIVEVDEPVVTSASGVEIGVMEFIQDAPTSTGGTISAQSHMLVFQTGDTLIMVQLVTPKEFAGELFPIMDDIAESVTLLK